MSPRVWPGTSDVSKEFDLNRTYVNGYRLSAAYTHSSVRTNAALDYVPTISLLGAQQSGSQAWDVPDRVISWGWLPVPLPQLRKRWDFVYTRLALRLSLQRGERQPTGSGRGRFASFPDYLSFSPGLEGPFHCSTFGIVFRSARHFGECHRRSRPRRGE